MVKVPLQKPVSEKSCTYHSTAEDSRDAGVANSGNAQLTLSPANILKLQQIIGNQAVQKMLFRKENAVSTEPTPPSLQIQREDDAAAGNTNDEGGNANVTDLEQDMRTILQAWQAAATDGVNLFATTELGKRIDDLGSANLGNILISFFGNAIWAATIFLPGGELVLLLRTFIISMAGIEMATLASIPHNKEVAIPRVQKHLQDYLYKLYEATDPSLRPIATEIVNGNEGISRYRALAKFLQANIKPEFLKINPTYGSMPILNKTAIRDELLKVATDDLQAVSDMAAPVSSYAGSYFTL